MPQKPIDIGINRTGIATSPIDSKRTIEAARVSTTAPRGNGHLLEAERIAWARGSEPVGTVPPPMTLKGLAKTVIEKLSGHKPTVFIDKLGERIAFERTGTRLYEALLAKFEAADVHVGGPTREELEKIRNDEHRHVGILREAMTKIGADPTAMTPSADVVGVSSLGWIQVLTDPRTTLTQCLDVMLMAELADNDGWSLLIELSDALEFDDLTQEFRMALLEEEDHLDMVRTWISTALIGQAGVNPTPPVTAA